MHNIGICVLCHVLWSRTGLERKCASPHITDVSIKSQCISNRVRIYFKGKVLPEERIVCKAIVVPFLDE